MKAKKSISLKSYLEHSQSLDIFSHIDQALSVDRPTRPSPKKSKRFFYWLLPLILIVVGFAFLKDVERWFEPVITDVELSLKAVSPQGSPVAGARVYLANRPVGLTDSFGEWRYFYRAPVGEISYLRVMKEHAGVRYEASQRVKVSQPIEGLSRLNLSLALESSRQPEQNKKVAPLNSLPSSYLSENHMSTVEINFVENPAVAGVLLRKHQNQMLRDKILPEVQGLLTSQGIVIKENSPWKLNFSYLPVDGDVGFIRVEVISSNSQGQMLSHSFLTSFAKTVVESARGLLRLIREQSAKEYSAIRLKDGWFLSDFHVAEFWKISPNTKLVDESGRSIELRRFAFKQLKEKYIWKVISSDACASVAGRECSLKVASSRVRAPVVGWQFNRLNVSDYIPEDAELYVSGYPAYRFSKGVYGYWADLSKSANLNVVSRGKLIFRSRYDHKSKLRLGLKKPSLSQKPASSRL